MGGGRLVPCVELSIRGRVCLQERAKRRFWWTQTTTDPSEDFGDDDGFGSNWEGEGLGSS